MRFFFGDTFTPTIPAPVFNVNGRRAAGNGATKTTFRFWMWPLPQAFFFVWRGVVACTRLRDL